MTSVDANSDGIIDRAELAQNAQKLNNKLESQLDVSHAASSDLVLGTNKIPASGNVGIGTASPGARLHVSGGDIQADGGIRLGGVTKSTWPSLVCQTVFGTPNLFTSSATCPAGSWLTGGGCDITGDSGFLTQNDDAPSGSTYNCNTGAQNSVVSAFAFCCQIQ